MPDILRFSKGDIEVSANRSSALSTALLTKPVKRVRRGLLLLLPLALQPAVGFGLSNNTSPFFPIYHQLSPSSHSQYLKISFYFFSPSFPGSSRLVPSSSWVKIFFGHPILLHSLQVTQRTYPLSILLYFLLYSTLLVLDSSYFSIPHLHIWDHIFF